MVQLVQSMPWPPTPWVIKQSCLMIAFHCFLKCSCQSENRFNSLQDAVTLQQQLWNDPDCQCLHLFLKKIHKPRLICLPSTSSKQVEDPTNALIMPIWFARRETGAFKLEPCTTFLWNSTKLHDLLLLQGDPVEKTRKTSREMLQGDAVSVVSLLCTGHHSISIHFSVSRSQLLEDTLTFVRPAFDEVICSGERVFAAEANALVHLPTTPSFVSYWWQRA